ncbi:MAG: SgcJ/EcaC family oxidoreductase [Pseudomonadota bacterium]
MTSSDEQQIRNLVATWMSATRAGDTVKVLTLMTDDVVFLVAGQPPSGKEKFAETMSGPPGAAKPQVDGRSEIQEIQVSGDLAFLWSRLTVEVTPPNGAKPMKRAGHTLTVFRKSGDKWLLARDANLLTPVIS